MDLFTNLAIGFGTAFKLTNLAYAFVGCLLGTLIGVLPGLGPLTTIAMLLPITYALSPDAALIMLAGIYYGAQYGGSTTAIVVNLPGESSSVVTTIDGYQMAIEGVGMMLFGTLLSLTGTDVNTGTQRFAFDIPQLFDGLDFVPLAMGIFGFAEIVKNLEPHEERSVMTQKITNMFPTKEDFRRMIPAIFRGTFLGTALGVLPGGGAVLSSFAAYTVEKKLSKHPEEFGKGAIEGVAGPEAANNAGAQTSFIPLLTLGLPSNVVMALMVGAMTIHNIQPGPQVMTKNPELFWGLIASMWVGNLMLVILNLPLVGLWVKLLTIPYRYLYPAIMVFCCIGVYSLKNDTFEVYEAALFCIFGYLLIKLQLPPAPMLLGLVLGPQIEENFRRAMLLSRGDATVFFTSPLSGSLLAIAAIAVIMIALPQIRATREEALKE